MGGRLRISSRCALLVSALLAMISPRISAADFPTTQPYVPIRKITTLLAEKDAHGPIIGAIVSGDSVYVATGGWPSNHTGNFLRVLKVPVNGQAASEVGKIPITPGPDPYNQDMCRTMCMGDTDIFVRNGGDGLYDFPTNGNAPFRLDTAAGLTNADVRSMAWMKGILYLGLGGKGEIVQVDPAKCMATVLSDGQGKQAKNILNDGDAFYVPWMVADPARNRILFFVHDVDIAAQYNGLGEYRIGHGFRELRSMTIELFNWGSQPHDKAVTLTLDNGEVVDFHLTDDSANVMSVWKIGNWLTSYDGLDRTHPRFPTDEPVVQQAVVVNDVMWTAVPWAQVAPGRPALAHLPTLTPTDPNPYSPNFLLEPVQDGKTLITAGSRGVFRLDLQ